MRRIILTAIVGFATGFLGLIVGAEWYKNEILSSVNEQIEPRIALYNSALDGSVLTDVDGSVSAIDRAMSNTGKLPTDNFVEASSTSTESVVFIQTVTEQEYAGGSIFDWFFEPRRSQRVGSGSGVIFSRDGYIVTNNHVIDGADVIRVTAGKSIYDAQLIGTDPSSDLAVIKIEGLDLPAIPLGSSSDVSVGEWVLAVGNPFNLTSTVTAGIVSAKGRNINILRDRFPIESFIQTDAAINPGNSGGALVNKDGQLIGINTAILSRTGSYAGYGFAVPVDIVKKVYNDIKSYGQVQKALMGAEYLDIDSDIAEKLELIDLDGVIVTDILRGSAADKGGLEKGDVLKKINGAKVESEAFLEEYLAKRYPGDEVRLELQRENKTLYKEIVLTNREGTTDIIKRVTFYSEDLGATFENLSKVERDAFNVRGGVKVVDFERRGFFAQLDIPEGFIITSVNGNAMESSEELSELLTNIRGKVIIVGIDKNGRQLYYPYRF
ncbi:MAG: trypsin-like peptidase domain-containing protein [Bacteroidota bacterium]